MRKCWVQGPLVLAAATFSAGLLVAASSSPAASAASRPNGDVSVNLFEWNWHSVGAECAHHLGPAGVGSVEVAPPEESASLPGHPWYEVYQPASYKLASRMGNELRFKAMTGACHRAGVKVIADAVLNHMAGGTATGTGYGGTAYDPGRFRYPGAGYSTRDFHHDGACPTSPGAKATQVWNCDLDSLPDLATGRKDVRAAEARYLNTLLSLGADGFRLDAAEWIPPADIAAVKSKLRRTAWRRAAPYIVQEVQPGYTSPQLKYGNYERTGAVIDFDYARDLKSAFGSGDLNGLNRLIGSNSGHVLPPGRFSLDIVANHDTERDPAHSTLTYADGARYTLASYFMLAYPFGSPQLYDGFTFPASDAAQSPPSTSSGMVKDVTNRTCGRQWQCLHRERGITGMIGWHNTVTGTRLEHWTATGSGTIAFSRGSKGWIAINDDGAPARHAYPTGLPAGSYRDVIGGTRVRVSGGRAVVTVPAHGAVAIDASARK